MECITADGVRSDPYKDYFDFHIFHKPEAFDEHSAFSAHTHTGTGPPKLPVIGREVEVGLRAYFDTYFVLNPVE
jgi:hypothetical protein